VAAARGCKLSVGRRRPRHGTLIERETIDGVAGAASDTPPAAARSRKGQVQRMIARVWRGWAAVATADDYWHHYETEVAEHLQQVAGFRGARLLRRHDGDEVMFTSITFFTSMDDVRAFAGEDPEQAVVEDAARRALTRWDERVTHHEVTVDLRS
jgi:heme-degrading monooxygenase HmoA